MTVISNPQGPETGSGGGVLRCGSWNKGTGHLRLADRLNTYPSNRSNDFGFRCVSGLD
jgi:formylglycine-generating enzyme required for sulfatase activity